MVTTKINNNMKTSMQELIEFIDDKFIVSNSTQISSIYHKVQELLEKEKEQIIDARNDGIVSNIKGYCISNEEYYNQTYNQNK
jgi:hypothetical protein